MLRLDRVLPIHYPINGISVPDKDVLVYSIQCHRVADAIAVKKNSHSLGHDFIRQGGQLIVGFCRILDSRLALD